MSEALIVKGKLRPLYLLVIHLEEREKVTLGVPVGKREDWGEECISGVS